MRGHEPTVSEGLFDGVSQGYAAHRPRYPDALFRHLASLCPARRSAWDCGTGSGQAALGLSGHFERVVATDVSRNQIAGAPRKGGVAYVVARVGQTPLREASVDLVTVAQAVHWFPLEIFYGEVRRVCRPSSVLAVWCYGLARISPEVDAVVDRLYQDLLGPDWPAGREQVDEGYARLWFPFPRHDPPQIPMAEARDLGGFVGYLRTWSAVPRHALRTGRDPIRLVLDDLRSAWGEPGLRREVVWPLHVLVGRV